MWEENDRKKDRFFQNEIWQVLNIIYDGIKSENRIKIQLFFTVALHTMIDYWSIFDLILRD